MESLIDGIKLTVLGMGAVFLFLWLMIIVVSVAAKRLAAYAHIFEQPAPKARPQKKKTAAKLDDNVAQAILAAVKMHEEAKNN